MDVNLWELSQPLPVLQNCLMNVLGNLVGIKKSWPLICVGRFCQIRPGADPGWGKNTSRGFPSSKYFSFTLEGYSRNLNA